MINSGTDGPNSGTDGPNSGTEGNVNYSMKGSKSFNYKTSITTILEDHNIEKVLKLLCH